MVKVFLVEDEAVIRNGIRNGIDWEGEGFQFVGDAADGELAYPSIKETKPDILITDIKMPFMDGLELSANIKKELPDVKIIILSGYNEFDYAKQAIKIGITEYLLKPISSAKLLEAVKKVAQLVKKEQADKQLREQYLQEMQENQEYEKQKFFERLLTEDMPMTEVLELGGRLGLDLSAGKYCIILFKVMTPGQGMEYSEQVVQAIRAIEGLEDKQHSFCFRRGVEGWAFLLTASGNQELEDLLSSYCNCLTGQMAGFTEVEYFGGIGSIVSRLREVKQSYYDADKAFANRFVTELNQIISYRELHKETAERIELHGLGSMENNREMIGKFLKSGVYTEVDQFVEMYFDILQENSLNSMMLRQYLVIDNYITAMRFAGQLGISKEELEAACGEIQDVSEYISSLLRTRQYVTELMRRVILLRDQAAEKRGSDIISEAKEYISKNYMTETISLNEVASHVNMSPSYFSTVFRNEASSTFVEYLTKARMDKAKELLMCSNMKTSEIGYEVGYKDAHYFSYIFKKTQGCSPKEYRLRRRG